MKLIAPSILSADFSKLGEEVKAVEAAGADWIHVDVMDGHYVPNITMGPIVVEAVKRVTSLPIDVHLMIAQPDLYIDTFIKAGADLVSIHSETCVHLNRSIQLIKNSQAKAGVVLNPATPLSSLEWVINDIDFVLLMSVNPGFGGQFFIPNVLEKIKILKEEIRRKGLQTLIQVDGGVNKDTIGNISNAGADVFVAGSAIFGNNDYHQTITDFRNIIDKQ